MGRRVCITGVELICANTENYVEFVEVLRNGESGVKECTLFDTSKLQTKKVGEIPIEFGSFDTLGEKERLDYMIDETLSLLLQKEGLDTTYFNQKGNRAMLSFATSLAGNEKIMNFSEGKRDYPYLAKIPQFLTNIKKKTGITGESYTTMTACASGTAAAGIAFDYITNDEADIAIVGGADPLREFACFGFHSLKSLSSDVCKPFDNERNGINIGEASVFFIFEEYKHARKRNAKIYAEIVGYGIGNDAYHMTTPDITGKGASRTMSKALDSVTKVDYINAHGTATKINDEMELKAIQQVFNDLDIEEPLYISSTKSLFGHCLGAAGFVELAVVVAMLDENFIPASRMFDSKMETDKRIELVEGEAMEFNGGYILSNSFAFGGNTASILLGGFEIEKIAIIGSGFWECYQRITSQEDTK